MIDPQRIQLRRTKGWRLPPNTIVVSRPSKWGNPFRIGESDNPFAVEIRDRTHATDLYRHAANCDPALIEAARTELRGKNLSCWCPLDGDCHADVLLEIANS